MQNENISNFPWESEKQNLGANAWVYVFLAEDLSFASEDDFFPA